MRKILLFIPIFICGFFLSNCGDTFSTVVELDPPEFEPKMTVTSFINSQDTFVAVFVGKNRGILESGEFDDYRLDSISLEVKNETTGAVISGEPIEQFTIFSYAYNYMLETDSKDYFSPGQAYTFTLDHKDFPTSSTTLEFPPIRENLRNITYKRNDGIDIEGDDNSSVSFEIVDNAETVDYYECELFSVSNFNGFGTFWIETTDPSGVKGFPDDNIFFSDESFNGEVKKIKVKFDRSNYDPDEGGILELKWRAISKDAYEYSKSTKRYNDTDGTPFLSPVQVHSNINNGLGNISLKTETIYSVN